MSLNAVLPYYVKCENLIILLLFWTKLFEIRGWYD